MTSTLLPILPVVDDVLFNFAQSDGFWANLAIAFGASYDVVKATELQQQWKSRNFSQIPPIEVLSDEVLGTANGAYSSSTNKIYLSASFLNTASSAAIVNVILEEIGHYVDAQINQTDSAGDEGAIFAELVQGNSLDVATLDALRAENDQTTIIVNGESIQVEQANLTGTNGNDNITGTSDSDNIFGLDGNDTLSGLGGHDSIYGGNGNDSLNGGDGSDYFTNDAGNDTINGGSGTDRYEVDYSSASRGLTMTYNTATGSGTITVGTETDTFTSIESFEGFKGTEYNDVIFGGTESESYYYYAGLKGGSGNDTISGNAGYDDIYGEDGNDVLNGGADNDQLYGGSGNDLLNGDAGDDYFTNEDGNDTINGGSGTDRYEADYSYASSGLTMTYDTATGSGTITVGTETDTFTSIENFNGFKGTEYNDVIFGGTAVEELKGGGGNDTISGNAGDDYIYGEDGNDVLNGGVGNDQLYGGNGNDLLNGDSGDDYFTGDEGNNDTINGGAGSDSYHADYSYGSSGLTMTYDTAGSGTITVGTETDTFTSIENFNGFKGTDYNDVIFGGTAVGYYEYLYGREGNDTISGNAGADIIDGENGNDVLNGGADNDQLYGGNGNDTLQGTDGGTGESDYLVGGSGSDRFILADTTKTFYDDGLTATEGTSDYAEIADFSTTDDIIQLRGSSSDYLLTVSGSTTNLYINKPGSEADELIAYITDQTALSLTASYFSYVSSPTLPSITLAVSPSSVTEDGTTNLVYTFTRTGSTTSALTANYTVGGTATNGTDYTSIPTSVTFAANSATATVTVDPTPDTTVEPDETVILTLAAGTGYTVGTPNAATGTITNDDTSVTLAVSPSSVTEDGTTNLVYTFTRSGVTTNALTVNYTRGGTATLNTDYTRTGTTNTVTFAAGSSTATVIVDPTADTTVEPDETVILTLAAGTGYTIGTPNAATGTITNDDFPSITLAVSPSSVTEDGTTNLVYTFTRTGVTTNALTVNYTLGGTATLNTDYTRTGTTNTVTFAANSATATVTVDPTADTILESNETVILTLATGTGYTVGTTTPVTGTINNDDSASISINDVTVSEGNSGTTNAVFTVTLSNPVDTSVTLNYSTANGTATTADNDYTAIATTPLTFNVGETSKTITVAVNGDTKVENNETFFVNLSNLQANGLNVTINDNQGQGTINDDDSTVTSQLSINDITVVEGQNSNAILTVTVNNPNSQAISVNYTTAPIDATANVDYTSQTGTLTIAPNASTATISIPILNDNLNEPDEAFTVTLSNPVNATINPDEAIGQVIITDTLQSAITRTLPTNVENLRLIGTNNINGTGNAGDNKITGNSGNNILAGGNGDDTYHFNASTPLGSDTIQETTTGGIDTIDFTGTNTAVRVNLGVTTNQTAVTNNLRLTFSANNTIENIIGDSGNDRLTGNSLNNTLTGGGGNDQLTGQNGNDSLIGGFGDDLLTGGNGSDNFIFNSSNLGIDAISDFTPGSDKIVLSKAIFTALQSIIGNGFSQPAEFASVDDDDLVAISSAFIVYSNSSGSIYYNQNGSAAGLGSGSEFANLLTVPTLIAADFTLIN
ncbi:Calx-beta domain-containing protein [Microcystis sp. M169S2]|uniref:beta strand repeat-containing protein n=1 Tax=Microcystis sp. M169S2 TaxID=2771157 RepID=UPI00258596A9|nr:Calx-beta domain-containing protein [Microcystis sp. M169S2]MCA2720146.1 M10 family metallopeptidase C-terminal domain-containing protein [Microcystis sp. M169S2]